MSKDSFSSISFIFLISILFAFKNPSPAFVKTPSLIALSSKGPFDSIISSFDFSSASSTKIDNLLGVVKEVIDLKLSPLFFNVFSIIFLKLKLAGYAKSAGISSTKISINKSFIFIPYNKN